MSKKTANIISFVLILGALIGGAFAYSGLPEQVATHFNVQGVADDYSPKIVAVLLGPVMAALCWFVMWLIPIISPKGFQTGEFQPTINVFQVALVAFMVAIGALLILHGYGYPVPIERITPIGIGILFIVLGNYFGKVRKNFFIGIRTPWTLASDEVWARTHRLAGYLFVFGGALILLLGLFKIWLPAIIGIALAAALIPVVYSFVIYKQIEGFDEA